MREFTFAVEYERGADPVAERFRETPSLTADAFGSCVSETSVWQVVRLSGPADALDRVEAHYRDDDRCHLAITERGCGGRAYTDAIERGRDERVLYRYVEGIRPDTTVQTLAARYLPAGLVYEFHHHGATREWRLLTRSDEKVGLLYDTLGARLRDGLSFHVGHLREADRWRRDGLGSATLPAEQREALDAAVESGYYETPRAVSLDDLAERLDVPRSTLSYRLRRAEAALATAYADATGPR